MGLPGGGHDEQACQMNKQQIEVKSKDGRVHILYPYVETDLGSGYPYDSVRGFDMTPEQAQALAAELAAVVPEAKNQRAKIKADRRAVLEAELRTLGDDHNQDAHGN